VQGAGKRHVFAAPAKLLKPAITPPDPWCRIFVAPAGEADPIGVTIPSRHRRIRWSPSINGDGRADIVTGAGPGGGPHVRIFDGGTGQQLTNAFDSFMAFSPSFSGGVFVGGS
jgi:hypothetical protein